MHTADPTGERQFTYDPAGRLVTETGPDGQRDHTYDAAGQLRTSTGPDGPRDYRYDQAGRRVAEQGADDGRSYRWDPFGRLTGVDTAVDGITRSTPFHVDALGELTHAGGVPLAWDTADPTAPPVAIGDQAVVGHGHPWALASDVLDVDWRHTVGGGADPWGQDAAGTDVGLGFRGELVVDGLVWLRARAYDPATRAFLTPDPLEAVLGTAFAANPYHYAGNDPVNQVDPLGLRPVTDAELAGEHDSGGGLFSKIGHGVLDVAGLVPGVGEVADLANAAWYTAEGDYTMAALSAAAAIPFAGWAATGAKAAIKGTAAAEKLTAKAAIEGTETAATRAAVDVGGGAARSPSFVVKPNGETVIVPNGAVGPTPTRNGQGFQFTGGSGGHGLSPAASDVRIMDPKPGGPYPLSERLRVILQCAGSGHRPVQRANRRQERCDVALGVRPVILEEFLTSDDRKRVSRAVGGGRAEGPGRTPGRSAARHQGERGLVLRVAPPRLQGCAQHPGRKHRGARRARSRRAHLGVRERPAGTPQSSRRELDADHRGSGMEASAPCSGAMPP